MKAKKIILIIIIFFICVIGGITFWANAVLDKMNYTDWSDTVLISEKDILQNEEPDDITGLKKVKEEDVIFYEPEQSKEINKENLSDTNTLPKITNILLIGEENVYNAVRGRTDSMMILSINKETETLKLISLMRDSYVQIPNQQDNRLNAAYAIGGVPLLKETIETNFDVTIDNTVLVNFEAFQKIIDILGGVDIEITKAECDYLNSGNYISEEENRILVPGLNHFNGNQALGYARIRYVTSINGESADFGRTNRHRTILNALYKEYKDADVSTLLTLVDEILPYVTTDISKTDIISYMMDVIAMSPDTLETFRIPIDDGYEPVSIRSMSVLQLDMKKNREALKNFIYNIESENSDEAEYLSTEEINGNNIH